MFIIPHKSHFVLRKHENSGALTFICFLCLIYLRLMLRNVLES